MQPVKCALSEDNKYLPRTSLSFATLKLHNNASVSVVVGGPRSHINDLLLREANGSFLLEMNSALTLCLRNDKKKENLFSIPGDDTAIAGVEWKLLTCKVEDFEYDLNSMLPVDLEERRVKIVQDLPQELPGQMMNLIKSINKLSVKDIESCVGIFAIIDDQYLGKSDFEKSVFPITFCLHSKKSTSELDELFIQSAKVGQCYIRFSTLGENNLTLVSRVGTPKKITKVAFSFFVNCSTHDNWVEFSTSPNEHGRSLLAFLRHVNVGVNSFNFKLFEQKIP